MRLIFRLAAKELLRSIRSLRLVALILFLGFIGPLTVSSIRTSVADYISERSRQILSADLSVSSIRPFKPEERKAFRELLRPVRAAEEIEFATMARSEKATTMVELHAVGTSYPVFGSFRLEGEAGSRNGAALDAERIAWVFPEVLAQLDLKIGEKVHLGESEFEVRAALEDAPGISRVGMGMAPRIYIAQRFAEETGLIRYGSQVFHRYYVALPDDLTVETAAASVKKALADPDIFLRTPDDSIQGLERFFQFFNSYLVVIAMAVFALSWGSAYYILQVYLEERLKNAAILLSAGASRAFAAMLYSLQVLMVLLVSLVSAAAVVAILIQVLGRTTGELLPEDFVLKLGLGDLTTMVLVSAASAVAFLVPLFAKIFSAPLGALLSENALQPTSAEGATRATMAGHLLVGAVFFAMSVWLMGSLMQALQLMGALGLAIAFGWSLGRLLFRGLFRLRRETPGTGRLVATNLARGRFGTNLGFLTLLLVALILNLIPHLLATVVGEVRPLKGRELPSLFLFNIPESSVEAVETLVATSGAELRFLSPMILARLTKVNGAEPQSDRFQRFPVRISYRENRIPSEVLVEGREIEGVFDAAKGELPALSIEQRFAERNGFQVGDELEFDVQGVPVVGRIANLRRVKWTEFNPNFFILFQAGVLEDAPKTFLANVNLDESAKVRLQYELIREFPDLSVIDIGRTVTRVLDVVSSVIGPLEAAAWFAIDLSFLILFAVVAHNLRLRQGEVEIEKLLGADASLIRGIILREYAWTAFLAWLFGAIGAAAITALVSIQIFDITPGFDWPAAAMSGFVVLSLTLAIALISTQKVLNLRGATRRL